jgi:hypothetical protein
MGKRGARQYNDPHHVLWANAGSPFTQGGEVTRFSCRKCSYRFTGRLVPVLAFAIAEGFARLALSARPPTIRHIYRAYHRASG